ncbi:hypothetical protein EK21DRAFT_113165 [Setomelanomma holmii]|uniref:Uncharacterized protein n=1 Tax=Setomelanomma holmii TaxID=210430 RepID=A0A9P4H8P8_9PLEO|nr:hypothetical protein EK21DRAFT_113165 [Setomelanomma holmii]
MLNRTINEVVNRPSVSRAWEKEVSNECLNQLENEVSNNKDLPRPENEISKEGLSRPEDDDNFNIDDWIKDDSDTTHNKDETDGTNKDVDKENQRPTSGKKRARDDAGSGNDEIKKARQN